MKADLVWWQEWSEKNSLSTNTLSEMCSRDLWRNSSSTNVAAQHELRGIKIALHQAQCIAGVLVRPDSAVQPLCSQFEGKRMRIW